jgi:hypothetical protein
MVWHFLTLTLNSDSKRGLAGHRDDPDDILENNRRPASDWGGGDLIRVNVDLWVIRGKKASVASTGTKTIRVSCRSSKYTVAPVGGPNRENVIIKISPIYSDAWKKYLRDLHDELHAKGYNPILDDLTLTILGKNTGSGVKDIYYYEKVTEIEVTI